jgi:putative redox protein
MTAGTVSAPTLHTPVEVEWVGGLRFDAGRPGGPPGDPTGIHGPKVRADGDAETGPSPFDLLLAAIATCAATDVVEIMKKQRTPLEALSIRVEAYRVPTTPRRLASAVLHFTLQGAGITAQKAERAVELSVTKYCSVRSSLIADAPVTWTIDLKC